MNSKQGNKPNQQNRERRKGAKGKRQILWGRVILLIVTILLLIGVLGYAGNTIYHTYLMKVEQGASPNVVSDSKEIKKETKYDSKPFQQDAIDRPMYILVLGLDSTLDNELHFIYLVSVNKDQHNIDIIGIPTNSKISGRDNKSFQPLEGMYKQGGLTLTKAVVEDIFHVQIPYFIVFNEKSFNKVYNILGPVDLFVEHNITQYNEDGSDIVISKGYQKMTDLKAWGYMTYADSTNGGAAEVQRQERLIKTVQERVNDQIGITRAIDVLRYWSSLETNISTYDAFKFALVNKIKNKNYNYYLLPGTAERIEQKLYWDIDPVAAQDLIGLTMNPKGDSND